MEIQTIIGISDKERYYMYGVSVIDSNTYVFLPRFRPERFDQTVEKYSIHLSYFVNNLEKTLLDKTFDLNDTLAMPEIKKNEDYFNEYVSLGEISDTENNIYVSLRILKNIDGVYVDDMDYNPGQGCIISKCNSMVYMPCVINVNGSPNLSMEHFPLDELRKFMDFSVEWKYKIKIYVVDDSNCFDVYKTDKLDLTTDTELVTIPMSTILRKFTDIPSYKPGLRLQATINIYDQNDDIFMTYRSIPYMLTPDAYARYLCDNTDDRWVDPDFDEIEEILNNMDILRPRITNETVTQVINQTNVKDSKQHIVQPVFFRVRDLGNCVFHPQVSENICLNLDYYKSAVSSFRLKLEGVIFAESARTNSGVIFNIQGNLLPGELDEGIYYILDQDSNLVTTGKYTYEY